MRSGQGEVYKHLRKAGRFSERRSSKVRLLSLSPSLWRRAADVAVHPSNRRRRRVSTHKERHSSRYKTRKPSAGCVSVVNDVDLCEVTNKQDPMGRLRSAISDGRCIQLGDLAGTLAV